MSKANIIYKNKAGGFPISVSQEDLQSFTVIYGKQVKDNLSYDEASQELGECIFHSLNCQGLLMDEPDEEEENQGPSQEEMYESVCEYSTGPLGSITEWSYNGKTYRDKEDLKVAIGPNYWPSAYYISDHGNVTEFPLNEILEEKD